MSGSAQMWSVMNNLNIYNLPSLSPPLNAGSDSKDTMISGYGKAFYSIIIKYNFDIFNSNHSNGRRGNITFFADWGGSVLDYIVVYSDFISYISGFAVI